MLVTDDDDVAAQAILMSGSYMMYDQHLCTPGPEVFERWKYVTPNFSMRMSNLAASAAAPADWPVGRARPALESYLRHA